MGKKQYQKYQGKINADIVLKICRKYERRNKQIDLYPCSLRAYIYSLNMSEYQFARATISRITTNNHKSVHKYTRDRIIKYLVKNNYVRNEADKLFLSNILKCNVNDF